MTNIYGNWRYLLLHSNSEKTVQIKVQNLNFLEHLRIKIFYLAFSWRISTKKTSANQSINSNDGIIIIIQSLSFIVGIRRRQTEGSSIYFNRSPPLFRGFQCSGGIRWLYIKYFRMYLFITRHVATVERSSASHCKATEFVSVCKAFRFLSYFNPSLKVPVGWSVSCGSFKKTPGVFTMQVIVTGGFQEFMRNRSIEASFPESFLWDCL